MRLAAIPYLGRGEPLESTFSSDNHYVLEDNEYSVFIAPNGNWHTFYPTIEFDAKQGRTCQLERQDQLQEMVGRYYWADDYDNMVNGHVVLLDGFQNWVLNDCTGLDWSYRHNVTLEQLWLAFVMAEKFKKNWNGETWLSAK